MCCASGSRRPPGVQPEQAADDLQVILDAVVNFAQKGFLLPQRGLRCVPAPCRASVISRNTTTAPVSSPFSTLRGAGVFHRKNPFARAARAAPVVRSTMLLFRRANKPRDAAIRAQRLRPPRYEGNRQEPCANSRPVSSAGAEPSMRAAAGLANVNLPLGIQPHDSFFSGRVRGSAPYAAGGVRSAPRIELLFADVERAPVGIAAAPAFIRRCWNAQSRTHAVRPPFFRTGTPRGKAVRRP